MIKTIISGITGQDGAILTELLLNKGHEVHGVIRRSSSFNTERIDHLYTHPKLHLHYGDITDYTSIADLVADIKPDYFYNLAAQSHVRVSFDIPVYTSQTVAVGAMHCLEAIRKRSPNTRFYQASSSEMFGSSPPPQNENTIFHPRSPYAVSKVYAYYMTVNYRESYDMFCSNGILFNHESPLRGETFVTKKVTRAVGRIYYGLQDKIELGNLDAKRDWAAAEDYCEGMIKILEHDNPDDFVLATGESHSVREFLELAFDMVGLDPYKYYKFNPKYKRPAEVDHLEGDATKAKEVLGWVPKIKFKDLVKSMVEYDLEKARKEKILKDNS
jgi:GDPmannose 4,6-dehydratase